MAFNSIYRLRIIQRQHNQQVVNVLHFKEDAIVVGSGAQALADDFRTNMDTVIRARAAGDLIFEAVEVIPLVPIDEAAGASLWAANTLGTRTGASPTGTVAEVLTLYTGLPGRQHRGRQYLAGVGSADMSLGLATSAQTTRTTAYATALVNRYARIPYVSSWVLGVWSRLQAGLVPPYSTNAFHPVTQVTVRTVLRNQRRRQLGVGR